MNWKITICWTDNNSTNPLCLNIVYPMRLTQPNLVFHYLPSPISPNVFAVITVYKYIPSTTTLSCWVYFNNDRLNATE
jgi:hypothetical protein